MKMDSLRTPLPQDIEILKQNGQFELVNEMIDLRLKKDIPNALKERLLLEKEILKEYPKAFIYTKEQAIALIQSHIIDFSEEEFDELFKESAFEFIFDHGTMKFKDDIYDNLVKVHLDYRNRSDEMPQDDTILEQTIQELIDENEMKVKIHVRLSLKVAKEDQIPGKVIRVWIPIPVEYSQVEDLKILSYTQGGIVNDNTVNHRSIYFECVYQEDMEFFVEYEFINHVIYHDLDASICFDDGKDFYLEEVEPHYVFTTYLKQLCAQIIGDETNPLLKAKKIYDYITSHVTYSFVPAYCTLPSIPEFVATSLKGDCGVQASLFITLCRIAHIPSRWQAGLYAHPQMIGNHDWAQFYVAPYGWLYADCSFGGRGYREHSDLRRNFYFGNIDPYRIPSARGVLQPLEPDKTFMRKDPYDHQTGEMEYIDQVINPDSVLSNLEIIEIKKVG
ncbi:transglutaminase-like domain-containing protein [Floccifex sp.]|uniref:transglutaminase-like domain-containing protein n=1 Tax=Floccifex sp. TaxID=2815810 RepID=UPI002A7546BC|nr:transglutaminase-like domain-containing protein [Floccifex sp.]MDD7281596.1 transglutaminase-like domain-containing protein [Erysipelotrichaceae bacterium]MDY2957480.1 transglutaminase-like domain-containing protein [Floccifex sp.]